MDETLSHCDRKDQFLIVVSMRLLVYKSITVSCVYEHLAFQIKSAMVAYVKKLLNPNSNVFFLKLFFFFFWDSGQTVMTVQLFEPPPIVQEGA